MAAFKRLIHIVRDGIERAAEARDLMVRIERIGIQRVANAESPRKSFGALSKCPARRGRD